MGGKGSSIHEKIEKAREYLEAEDTAREKILALTREAVRLSRKAIFKIHEGDLDEAYRILNVVNKVVGELLNFKSTHPRLFYSGSVSSAIAEYVEARVLYAYRRDEELPSYQELMVEPAQYLLGLADFTGELRRLLIRSLSRGDYASAERALKLMEEIFQALATIDVPDALATGLRHKVDVLRALIEGSSRDLLYHITSSNLEKSIRSLLDKLVEKGGV